MPARSASWRRWSKRASRPKRWSRRAAIDRKVGAAWVSASSHDRYTGGAARPKMRGGQRSDPHHRAHRIRAGRGECRSDPGDARTRSRVARAITICPTVSAARRTSTIRATSPPSSGCSRPATAANKPLGWLVPNGDAAQRALQRGFRCICIGHEVAVLRNALAQEFANARKGDPATP